MRLEALDSGPVDVGGHPRAVRLEALPSGPVDVEALCRALSPQEPSNRALGELCGILSRINPRAEVAAQLDLLQELGAWLESRGKLPRVPGAVTRPAGRVARLELIAATLERAEPWRMQASRWLAALLSGSRADTFFCTTGLPSQPGFFSEALERTAHKLLPKARDLSSLPELLTRVFRGKDGTRWLLYVPGPLFERLGHLLGQPCWAPLRTGMIDAMGVLAGRVSSMGLAEDIRVRGSQTALRHSVFTWLPRVVTELVADPGPEQLAAMRLMLQRVEDELDIVHRHLEDHGVSVDLVYRLELIHRMVLRLGRLTELCFSDVGPHRFGMALQMFTAWSEQMVEARSVRALWRTNTTLLARKVVERAGHRGEHYITHTRGEYKAMLWAAGGGGVLTIFTAAIKMLVAHGNLPLAVEGLAAAANYAASFLLLQVFALALATKQPAMTAPALANALRQKGGAHLSDLTTLIAQMIRSQLAVAVGNLALVIPGAFCLDLVVRLFTGHPLLDEHAANDVLASLDIRRPSTMAFASLTGVLLFLSGLCAGWFENWVVFRRLPEAIAHHPLGKVVGVHRMKALARKFAHGASGIGGNVSLGLLLGLVPMFGKLFGLPMEVRHLTLQAGTLGLALGTLRHEVLRGGALWAVVVGLFFVGLANFGVSFCCALWVAIRAHGGERGLLSRLTLSVLRRMKDSPLEFVLPPADSELAIEVDLGLDVTRH